LYKLAQWYLGVDPIASTLQALVDFILIAALCLVVDYLMRKIKQRGNDRALFPVFCNYLVLVAAIVFMSASAVIFSGTSSS
jgi:hypothetical protein